MTDDHAPRGGDTREKIKQAARCLFAERGIDAVSIRDITKAAGQKNAGSVNYYFRSKEALIGELIADVAAAVEVERNRRVDAMEAAGGPRDMREVLAVLIDLSPLEGEVAPVGEDAIRFMKRVMASHSELLFEAIHFDLDTATRRCVAHLRRLMPAMPPALVGLRIRLAMLLAFAGLSSREAAAVSPDLWPAGWTAPVADANLIDALEGLLCQPPSAEAINLTE